MLCELQNDIFEQAAKLFSCFGFHGKTWWMWVTKTLLVQKTNSWYRKRHLCISKHYQYPPNLFVLFGVYMHLDDYKYRWLCMVHRWQAAILFYNFCLIQCTTRVYCYRNFILLLAFPSSFFLFLFFNKICWYNICLLYFIRTNVFLPLFSFAVSSLSVFLQTAAFIPTPTSLTSRSVFSALLLNCSFHNEGFHWCFVYLTIWIPYNIFFYFFVLFLFCLSLLWSFWSFHF